MKTLNIFFIHSKALKERQSVLDNFTSFVSKHKFKNIKLGSIEIIEDYDVDDITVDIIKKYVNYDKIPEKHVELYNQFLKNMHINQLSNSLKHWKAICKIATNSNPEDLNLILEDDILFEAQVCTSLENMIKCLPEKYDIVFTGFPTITEVPISKKYTFENTQKIFRILPFCDSYLISNLAAITLANNMIPIKFSNNIQLSYIAEKIGSSTLQCVPNVFIDGSKFGMFLSKLSPNNPLIFNDNFTNLRSFVNKETLTNEDINSIDTIINTTPIKNNPDFILLECQYHIKMNNIKKALERYKFAYQTYIDNGCILSNESIFLKDYIRIHKHIQSDIDV